MLSGLQYLHVPWGADPLFKWPRCYVATLGLNKTLDTIQWIVCETRKKKEKGKIDPTTTKNVCSKCEGKPHISEKKLVLWAQYSGCVIIRGHAGYINREWICFQMLPHLGWESLCPFIIKLDSHPLTTSYIHCQKGIHFVAICTRFELLLITSDNIHYMLSF